MLAFVRTSWNRVCLFLRGNALFCLSVLLCAALLRLIPQIANVMFQLLLIEPNPATQSLTLAVGFLAYLGFLLAGAVAAVFRVVPPDVSRQPPAFAVTNKKSRSALSLNEPFPTLANDGAYLGNSTPVGS